MYQPKQTTYFEITANKIAELTLKNYGRAYQALPGEMGNGDSFGQQEIDATAHTVECSIQDEVDQYFQDPAYFNDNMLMEIVERLVIDGHIPAGEYLVTASWG